MLRCIAVRTTIRIDDDLYREAKATAARSGRSVGDLIEDALRTALRSRKEPRAELGELPVFGGSGVMPGVDLADPRALRELMDEGRSTDALR
jgi:hypothetical protein